MTNESTLCHIRGSIPAYLQSFTEEHRYRVYSPSISRVVGLHDTVSDIPVGETQRTVGIPDNHAPLLQLYDLLLANHVSSYKLLQPHSELDVQ